MKKIVLFTFLCLVSFIGNAQTWKSHPKKPYSNTDSCLVFQDSTKKFYRVKCSEIGGSATIDTLKVFRVEQGRGTAKAFGYFNGVAWVMNDTSYIPRTGSDNITGNLKRLGSDFKIGLTSNNSFINFGDYSTQITTQGGASTASVQIGSGASSNVSLISGSGSTNFSVSSTSPTRLTGNYIDGDQVYRTDDSLRYIQLKDAQERFAPIGGGAVSSVFGRTGAVVADSGDYDISQITGGLSDTLADGKIWIGDGTNTAFPRTLSGDVTISNLGVASYNGVVGSTKGGAGTVSGILKANGSGTVSAAAAGTDYVAVFSQYKTAYVDTLGDNATAIVGRIDRKFATIDAALAALPSSGGVVEIGVGTFQSPSSANLKNNIWLKGSQKPDFNWTVTPSTTGQTRTAPTKLVGGTILQNSLSNGGVQLLNMRITDLGVDVGSAWCTANNGGVGKDAIIFGRNNSVPNVTTPVTNVQIENVTVLGQSASSLFHDILFDNGYDIFVQNVRTCFNVHGIVIKGSVGNVNNVECFGHQYDGIIVKSNNYAYARAVNLSNIYIGSVGSYDGAGIHLQNGETGADAVFYGVNISNFFIDRTTRGITIQNEGVDNVNINNGTIWFPQTHGIYSPTGHSLYNTIISNLIVRGSGGVGLLINNAYNTTIADVLVTASATTGCNLSGNGALICSNLIETTSGGTGIIYGSNVYAYNVQASSSSGVATKINIEGVVGSSVGNTAIDLSGSSPYFNFRKPLILTSYYTSTYRSTNGGSDLPVKTMFWSGTNDADLNFYGSLFDVYGYLNFIRSNGTNKIAIAGIRPVSESTTAGSESGSLVFETKPTGSASTEKMRILSTGNVGIGISTPAKLLTVRGTSLGSSLGDVSYTGQFETPTSNVGAIQILNIRTAAGSDWTTNASRIQYNVDNSNAIGYVQFAGSGIQFGTGGTGLTPINVPERMRITDIGNVGIGVVTPTAFLHLKAGTTSYAPFRIAGGVAPTSPNTFDIWSETTNNRLMFRQNAANVEVLGASAVNYVSPTSPNRTITILINGTTYYLHAKTTND